MSLNLRESLRSVVRGPEYTCVLTDSGRVGCLGKLYGLSPDLSKGTKEIQWIPKVTGVSKITAEVSNTCALTNEGALWCWGERKDDYRCDDDGINVTCYDVQRKDGFSTLKPERVLPSKHVVDIASGALHTCAIDKSKDVWCWGEDHGYGYLGSSLGYSENRESRMLREPIKVENAGRAIAISAEHNTTCVIKEDHSVWCWGLLEIEDRQKPYVPKKLGSINGAKWIKSAGSATCIGLLDGKIRCCGNLNEDVNALSERWKTDVSVFSFR
jgi:alpha-tubulin suppressor-like RCC1 family protein